VEQWIELQDIDSGSVASLELAGPVTDLHGNVLVAAGARLTPALLVSLQRRGITRVLVHGPDADAPDDEAVRARIQKLFRKGAGSVASSELKLRMLAYRTGGAA